MQILNGVEKLEKPLEGAVVTIGNFDGVHRGHQQLVENLIREAQFFGVPAVVYTFHPHPVRVLHPEKSTHRLFDLKDQQEQFEERGIDFLVIQPFTVEFSRVSPEFFLKNYIVDKLRPKTLVVGHDFSFGANRGGNIHFLEQFCADHGIRLIVIPPYKMEGSIVSSSSIREKLKNGDVESANMLLGRRYYLRGHVETGYQRGRTIGVPTANVHPDVEFVPRNGVYCTLTKVRGISYPSITNIGLNPTFQTGSERVLKIETHIFNFQESIYGEEIETYLLHFIRDEKKFSGLESLKVQIQHDIEFAQRYFNEQKL